MNSLQALHNLLLGRPLLVDSQDMVLTHAQNPCINQLRKHDSQQSVTAAQRYEQTYTNTPSNIINFGATDANSPSQHAECGTHLVKLAEMHLAKTTEVTITVEWQGWTINFEHQEETLKESDPSLATTIIMALVIQTLILQQIARSQLLADQKKQMKNIALISASHVELEYEQLLPRAIGIPCKARPRLIDDLRPSGTATSRPPYFKVCKELGKTNMSSAWYNPRLRYLGEVTITKSVDTKRSLLCMEDSIGNITGSSRRYFAAKDPRRGGLAMRRYEKASKLHGKAPRRQIYSIPWLPQNEASSARASILNKPFWTSSSEAQDLGTSEMSKEHPINHHGVCGKAYVIARHQPFGFAHLDHTYRFPFSLPWSTWYEWYGKNRSSTGTRLPSPFRVSPISEIENSSGNCYSVQQFSAQASDRHIIQDLQKFGHEMKPDDVFPKAKKKLCECKPMKPSRISNTAVSRRTKSAHTSRTNEFKKRNPMSRRGGGGGHLAITVIKLPGFSLQQAGEGTTRYQDPTLRLTPLFLSSRNMAVLWMVVDLIALPNFTPSYRTFRKNYMDFLSLLASIRSPLAMQFLILLSMRVLTCTDLTTHSHFIILSFSTDIHTDKHMRTALHFQGLQNEYLNIMQRPDPQGRDRARRRSVIVFPNAKRNGASYAMSPNPQTQRNKIFVIDL
ncbi:uncharacterized protein MYCFIDRAFT_207843 [Pseudocercospora fijiensis CIRAD86]|uniref:Uncharacterized protein n=1 Tax=Pseudocercospora fijiensis (strain CIRAD86) TaxID=383855 RepID=M2ZX82_PSEFD|nr:uncharacterized protein MYCFIDRAFT_207843 [Pseudocercospora fijiensis CIRAD86]EME83599.1 hypothetical protein MYCFIDRAFT_207843 [Pseudocercospora fijiensis CIRAD86]